MYRLYASKVGTAQSVKWLTTDWTIGWLGFDCRHVQTGSGAHPASYPMGTGGSFPGREAEHSNPSSAEVKGFV
jgi:hypothetical protein